jgi:hypothetical protein
MYEPAQPHGDVLENVRGSMGVLMKELDIAYQEGSQSQFRWERRTCTRRSTDDHRQLPEDEDVRAALAASQADPAKVTVLRDLGISEELARKALEVCSNNADRAAEWAITRDVSDVEGFNVLALRC